MQNKKVEERIAHLDEWEIEFVLRRIREWKGDLEPKYRLVNLLNKLHNRITEKLYTQSEVEEIKKEERRKVLRQMYNMVEDELLVIDRDGGDIVLKYIEEWLSKLTKEK